MNETIWYFFVPISFSLFFIILVGILNHFSLMENIEEEEKKKTIKMRAEEERKRLEIEGEKAQQKARQNAQLREEQQRLKRHAEEAEAERIRTQSQIWVIG